MHLKLIMENKPEEIKSDYNSSSDDSSKNLLKKIDIKANGNKNDKYAYHSMIKDYLNKNVKDSQYATTIKENPDLLFEKMSVERLVYWESILYFTSSPLKKNDENEILFAPLEREDQNVIKNDSKRTRVRESILVPGFPRILEALLTYYCNLKQICYKQGLNEIFGPLLLLKYKFKNIKYTKLFDILEVFIDQYLPNYYYEKDLCSLNSSLSLFVILLKYHEPSVYNRFDTTEIVPQMYATNAIITLMSGKLKLNLVYELWEKIIKSKDPLIMHFILVAFYITHREMIINCDKSFLATLLTTITINSMEELNSVFDLALKLREFTPYSYRILANKIGFLKKNYKKIKETYKFYKPESIPAMPITPLEILTITNKSTEQCVDPSCRNCILNKNYIKDKNELFDWNEEQKIVEGVLNFEKNLNAHICEKCDMKIEKKMQYILLDLRILNYEEEDDDTEKTGFLPMMINVDQNELKSEDFNKITSNRFANERGNYHFYFLTSSTENFSLFESKYYTEKLSELDRKKMMFGLIKQRKIDKTLNLLEASKSLTWKEIYKLKEYDNFRNVLKTMQKENFPYVGYVYGGFNEVHDMSIRFGYELLFHNELNCILCKQKKDMNTSKKKNIKIDKEMDEKLKSEISESLWEHKKKIVYSKINEIYNGKKSNTYLCILLKYKNKEYINQKQKVLIILLSDEFSIEFFKFDSKKIYKEIHIKNDEKEEKKKKLEYYDLGKEDDDMDKETELSLFDKKNIKEVKSLNMDKKFRNIIKIVVLENKDKEKDKDKKKQEKQELNSYEIVLDFSSINDSKNFAKCFKSAVNNYRLKIK